VGMAEEKQPGKGQFGHERLNLRKKQVEPFLVRKLQWAAGRVLRNGRIRVHEESIAVEVLIGKWRPEEVPLVAQASAHLG